MENSPNAPIAIVAESYEMFRLSQALELRGFNTPAKVQARIDRAAETTLLNENAKKFRFVNRLLKLHPPRSQRTNRFQYLTKDYCYDQRTVKQITDGMASSGCKDWVPAPVTGAAGLQAGQSLPVFGAAAAETDTMIWPMDGVAGGVGVLLVHPSSRVTVEVNGILAAEGIHLLRHGDRVDLGDQWFWVSASATVVEAAYDPTAHGEDVFCFLTKARITVGQSIKICPGVPGKSCGVIYKSAAWDLAMQPASAMKCPQCGYCPSDDQWQPPAPKQRTSLDGILRAIKQ